VTFARVLASEYHYFRSLWRAGAGDETLMPLTEEMDGKLMSLCEEKLGRNFSGEVVWTASPQEESWRRRQD